MKRKVKSIYSKYVSYRLSWIVLIGLIVILGVCGYLYSQGNLNEKWLALIGGLISSLIAVGIQFLMGWNEHREIESFKEMGLLKVLPNRDGKETYYYELLKNAKKRLDFLGNTSYSFLDDFGGTNIEAGEKVSAILRAMERGVNVRIMVIDRDNLDPSKHQKFDAAEIKLKALSDIKPNQFKYTYIDQTPSYTLVTVDDECIVGGIIPLVESDVTSAVHALKSSPFLKCYLDHFDKSWNEKIKLNKTTV
jgi:hypothetical protein